MPSLRNHHSAQFTKAILAGDSGTGKTGAVASLAEAGFNVRVLDFDNGMDILFNYLKNSTAAPIDGIAPLDRVEYITITDKFKNIGGKAVPMDSTVWPRAIKYLEKWSNAGETIKGIKDGKPANIPIPEDQKFDLGDPSAWGPDCILVLDSFTFLNNGALRYILKLNNRPAGPVWESDWNEAQQLVEALLGMLYSEQFQTNVLVIAHVAHLTQKDGTPIGSYPAALGKALPPKIGRYFNTMLEIKRVGTGASAARTIHTVPQGPLQLKNPNPTKIKPSYDIKTGLADIFKALRG